MCVGSGCCTPTCPIYNNVKFGKYATRNGWKERKRIVEFHVLLLSEPVPLTFDNVIGEMQKGLGGYLDVACQNPECCFVITVHCGKTHQLKNALRILL